MKKYLLLPLVVLSLCACAKNNTSEKAEKTKNDTPKTAVVQENTVAKGYQKGADVQLLSSSAELIIPIEDANYLFNDCDAVALVKIDSILGGDNFSEITQSYVFPYTYGKMTVLASYKGNLTGEVDYTRIGGVIPYEKYYEGLEPAQKEKVDAKKAEGLSENAEYVQQTFEDDLTVEAGKTYLVYLKKDTYYHQNAYTIFGLEGGMREVSGDSLTRSALKVKNNFTGEWESLATILPE